MVPPKNVLHMPNTCPRHAQYGIEVGFNQPFWCDSSQNPKIFAGYPVALYQLDWQGQVAAILGSNSTAVGTRRASRHGVLGIEMEREPLENGG